MKTDHLIRNAQLQVNPHTNRNNQDRIFLPNKVGETHAVRVTDIVPGNLTLEFINLNFKLTATTSLQFKQGQSLTLELTQTSPSYEFKVVHVEPDIGTKALKMLLPRQAALQDEYLQWFKILPRITKNEAFSEVTKLALQQFYQSLPKTNDLSNPAILRLLLLNSGLFHEKKPSDSSSANSDKRSNNIKSLLIGLINQMSTNKNSKEFPLLFKDFINLTEGALSKILMDQLISTAKGESDQQQWIITLPYLEKNTSKTIDIKIKQEKNHTGHLDINNWTALIRLSPSTLGQITCKLSHNQATLYGIFWCENDNTSQLFKDKIDMLQNQLQQAGLKIGHLTVSQGIPEQQYDFSSFDGRLVNEKV